MLAHSLFLGLGCARAGCTSVVVDLLFLRPCKKLFLFFLAIKSHLFRVSRLVTLHLVYVVLLLSNSKSGAWLNFGNVVVSVRCHQFNTFVGMMVNTSVLMNGLFITEASSSASAVRSLSCFPMAGWCLLCLVWLLCLVVPGAPLVWRFGLLSYITPFVC